MKESIIFLALVGGATLLCFVFNIIYGLYSKMKKYLEYKAYVYKRNHRFDKPPLAKCYCKDCIHGVLERDGYCKCSYGIINHSADSFFCKDATPRTKDTEKCLKR